MAERRMIAKTIIDSDLFLDMPMSTQCLYFHLNMRADDDGFINNPKKIQRMIGCNDDDIKLLIAKSFIIPFESGVVVIKHWKIHNYIRGDRKKDTIFKDEVKLLEVDENGAYIKRDYIQEEQEIKKLSSADIRKKAYEESSLPYSFEYKIKKEFIGDKCPICGCTMSYENNLVKPSIQHNIPLSKGGEHELGNISVICLSCNSSTRNDKTGPLNSEKVIEIWDKLNDSQVTTKCQSSDNQVTYPGKDRLGKDRLGKDNIPTKEECVNKYVSEKLSFMSKLYQKNIGMANGIVGEWLIDISNQIDVDLFKKALEICTEKGKLNFGYLKGIIKNWLDINITSLEQLQAYEIQNNKTSNNSITSKQKNIPATQKQCDDAEFKRRLEESNKLLDSLDENIWGD